VTTLYPYQTTGARWLADRDQAFLADDMGLGKSAQALTACDLVQARNVLVICPAALRINWTREHDIFSETTRNTTVISSAKVAPRPGFNVVSYDLVAASDKTRKALHGIQWDALILDEAHMVKERTAKRTRAIYGHGKTRPGLITKAKRTWRLSGTPILNYANELWTHLHSMKAIQLPYWDFVFRYCSGFEGDWGYKITGHKNTEELKMTISPFLLRRKKEAVLQELPPITFSEVVVERSPVDLDPWFLENIASTGSQDILLANLKNVDQTLKTAIEAINANDSNQEWHSSGLKLLDSFKGATATMRRYIGHAKLPKALDIIEAELESGQIKKLVIFCVHQQIIELTRQRLRKFNPVTLFGETPHGKRQGNIDKFQNNKSCRVFIGQIQAAGAGITLTAAHHIAFLEQDWTPAMMAQASMRCHRIGQRYAVNVRFFTCAGSVDEQINKILINKTREIAKIID